MNQVEQMLLEAMEAIANSADCVCRSCGHIDNEQNLSVATVNGKQVCACPNCLSTDLSWGCDGIADYVSTAASVLIAARNK